MEIGIKITLNSTQVKLNIFVGPDLFSNIPARKQTDVYFFSRTKALNEYRWPVRHFNILRTDYFKKISLGISCEYSESSVAVYIRQLLVSILCSPDGWKVDSRRLLWEKSSRNVLRRMFCFPEKIFLLKATA